VRLLLGLAIASIGCSVSGESILICHNANCAPGATVTGDDKLDSLRASLALRMPDGSVAFDGIELDSVWDRALGHCTFTHAPELAAPDFGEAIELVAAHVRDSPPNAAARGVFYLKIELKIDVGEGHSHTPLEVADHVACVTRAAQAVIATGAASQNLVISIFDADDPSLLAAFDPGAFGATPGTSCLFETGWSASLPPGFVTQILTLNWYDYRRSQALDLNARIGESRGWDRGGLAIWARSPSLQELYAMLVLHPAYLTLNNIQEARGLLDAQ
jgi:hypothetical protein